jgi:uncharacterized membrane protein YphA (DoxX/SURF4 family)
MAAGPVAGEVWKKVLRRCRSGAIPFDAGVGPGNGSLANREDKTMTATTAQRTTTGTTRSLSRHLPTVVRVVLGLLFFVMGLNGFLNFLPQNAESMPEGALAFSTALALTGYMLPLTMGVQLASGILLLANRFVPLALALLAPVVVNIFAFHVFLAPSGLVIAIAVAAMEVGLVWAHRDAFRAMLRA